MSGHPSTFSFADRDLVMIVYVDDLLLSGASHEHSRFWQDLEKLIKIENVDDLGRFLGRRHKIVATASGKGIAFNVRDYMKSAVDMYLGITKQSQLKPANTPFLPRASSTPEEWEEQAQLQTHACAVLMKLLWGARLGRPDLLKGITYLATFVSRWCKACDRMLHRLMCYVAYSTDYTLVGRILDLPENLWLELFVDADFSGDSDSAHSTNGVWLRLAGSSGSNWPLSWVSKKQTAVSRSATESEVIALAQGLFAEALPMCTFWETVLRRKVDLVIFEDNEATEKVIRSGYSQKLPHN